MVRMFIITILSLTAGWEKFHLEHCDLVRLSLNIYVVLSSVCNIFGGPCSIPENFWQGHSECER